MGTFLFDKIVFGPVISRRLGVSLGINLLPVDRKICSFDCIYCECGRNTPNASRGSGLPKRDAVRHHLEETLIRMKQNQQFPDVITFAGNGEPTLHPEFAAIIDDTILLRDIHAPNARIAVLSNATMLHRDEVFNALLKVDDNIQKIDSAFEETIKFLDMPVKKFSLKKVVDQLTRFEGKVIIQTMFIRGTYKGRNVDNTAPDEIEAWIEILKIIGPSQVMIYTIERDTPVETLEKVPLRVLKQIAEKVKNQGLKVQVSG